MGRANVWLLGGGAILACIAYRPSAADESPVVERSGDEFRVNYRARRGQGGPRVAFTADSEFVVVWDGQQSRERIGVFRRHFACGGVPSSIEELTNSVKRPANRHDNGGPDISSLGSGDFMVAWTEDFIPRSDSFARDVNIIGHRFGASGGSEFVLSAETAEFQRIPKLAAAPDGSFVVAWNEREKDIQAENRSAIQARVFDAAGAPVSGDIMVTDLSTGIPINHEVTMAETGEFVVVWQELFKDGNRDGIVAKRYSSAGTALGTEIQVNQFTTHNQQEPHVVVSEEGDFVIVWQSYTQDGSDDGIFARRFDSEGMALGSEFQLNAYTTGRQEHPVVSAIPGGGFVATWKSDGQDGDKRGVFGRTFDPSGVPTSTEFQVNTYTTGDQGGGAAGPEHHLDIDKDGNMIAVWSSLAQDGDNPVILAQRFRLQIPLCGHASHGEARDSGCRRVTVVDALATLAAAMNMHACDLCVCDVDGSGAVTASDAAVILAMAVGLPVQLNCGRCN